MVVQGLFLALQRWEDHQHGLHPQVHPHRQGDEAEAVQRGLRGDLRGVLPTEVPGQLQQRHGQGLIYFLLLSVKWVLVKSY